MSRNGQGEERRARGLFFFFSFFSFSLFFFFLFSFKKKIRNEIKLLVGSRTNEKFNEMDTRGHENDEFSFVLPECPVGTIRLVSMESKLHLIGWWLEKNK